MPLCLLVLAVDGFFGEDLFRRNGVAVEEVERERTEDEETSIEIAHFGEGMAKCITHRRDASLISHFKWALSLSLSPSVGLAAYLRCNMQNCISVALPQLLLNNLTFGYSQRILVDRMDASSIICSLVIVVSILGRSNDDGGEAATTAESSASAAPTSGAATAAIVGISGGGGVVQAAMQLLESKSRNTVSNTEL